MSRYRVTLPVVVEDVEAASAGDAIDKATQMVNAAGSSESWEFYVTDRARAELIPPDIERRFDAALRDGRRPR